MRWLIFGIALAVAIVATTGCGSVLVGIRPSPTVQAGSAASATPTEVVWFPPTETPAAVIALTRGPTPERKPGVGALIAADKMTSSTHWDADSSGQAPVTVSDGGLTVSAEPGQPPVISLHRSAVFDDMYMEVTARPSLCRDRDAYGLVFRAPNDVAYYRFIAICDGTAAAERISLGTPRVLQPPIASADVPVGAPGEVRLGVWSLGHEFRFFLNNRYQFTVIDGNYVAGGIGVFAQAGATTPVVVTFSDLAVYRLNAELAQSTATP